MKEWEPSEAIEAIASILVEETTEDQLSEEDAAKLAKKIVERLEQGP